jgi:hypothetical protein
MNVSYFGIDYRISAPSTVHPSVLSVLSLIDKIKSEIWSKQQKPFIMRNSFYELRRYLKDHVKLCDNRTLLANWTKKCCPNYTVLWVVAATKWQETQRRAVYATDIWYALNRQLYICAWAHSVCSYCLYDRWHESSDGLDASVDKARACFQNLLVRVWFIFAPSEDACLEKSVAVRKRSVLL